MEPRPSSFQRKIIHIDMDAFFASVEQRDDPSLLYRPVVVGGSPEKRGVVASASYEARRYGIKSAMSSAMAKRLCPEAVFLFPNIDKYRKVSERIHGIFLEVTSLVEPLSLDEAYLDVTENKLGEKLAGKIAQWIRARIRSELNLTASAGVGPNKFIAKVASDLKKPDGCVIVPPERVAALVRSLPVEKLWGVGPATARRLHELGLWSALDIQTCNPRLLERAVGKYASFLQRLAFGDDDRWVEPEREAKSLGTETTFDRDLFDTGRLQDLLGEQAAELEQSLKSEGRPARTITLKVKYGDFQAITRSRTLPRHTDQASQIAKTAIALLLNATEAGSRPIRLLGISVSGFWDMKEPEQLCFDWDLP